MTKQIKRFEKKVALVTGGRPGIGLSYRPQVHDEERL